jgi:hypothetical protein
LVKSLSSIPNLKDLKLDLTTVDKVEIILRNLPNLKMLNDKEIKPDLFSEDNIEENKDNTNLKNKEKNNELEYENIEPKEINNNINYNDQLIIEKNELEKNTNSRNETELPDSNIESEIESYDVSFILFKFKYIV